MASSPELPSPSLILGASMPSTKCPDMLRKETDTFAAPHRSPEISPHFKIGSVAVQGKLGNKGSSEMNKMTKAGKARAPIGKVMRGNVSDLKTPRGLDENALVRKRKSKKTGDEKQSHIIKAKISKPLCSSGGKRNAKVGKAIEKKEPGACHEPQLSAPGIPPDRSLGLDKAIARRKDWTPVKEKAYQDVLSKDSNSPCACDYPILDLTAEGGISFSGSLEGRFNYTAPLGQPMILAQNSTGVATKRRKVELVDNTVGLPAPAPPAKKVKAPKKKAQTITSKATAPYASKPRTGATLLEHFPRSQSTTDIASDGDSNQDSIMLVTGLQTPKATAKNPSSKLHAPEEAIRALESQDLLFGTSSQLVREDSPSVVRDLQQALLNSQEDIKDSSFHSLGEFEEGGPEAWSKSRSNSTKRLWCAAARDDEGLVLNKEIIDLCDTPGASSGINFTPSRCLQAQSPKLNREVNLAEQISETLSSNSGIPISNVALPEAPEEDNNPKTVSLPRCIAECALKDRPKPRTTVRKPRKEAAAAPAISTPFDEYTDAKLKKAVADFGFKATKSRKKMISILERCRMSKEQSAAPEPRPETVATTSPTKELGNAATENPSEKAVSADDNILTPAPQPVAKRRGRPEKSPALLVTDPPTRSDTTCVSKPLPNLIAAPTKASKATTSTAAAATKMLASSSADTPPFEPPPPPDPLLQAITLAITAQPPTHNPSAPSWNEKILLYDPIVLEDLTVWLNSEGLGKVGVDDEVRPSLVREWCESNSVCCVWRVNYKGLLRKGL